MKHTPGPWEYKAREVFGPYYVLLKRKHVVAQYVAPENGPLIAAAPKLLDVLQEAVECLETEAEAYIKGDSIHVFAMERIIEKGREAIAEATKEG